MLALCAAVLLKPAPGAVLRPGNSLVEYGSPITAGRQPIWDKVLSSGFEDGCSEDSDGDRLKNCVETNTGQFVSSTSTGTDPADPDSDDDGLPDGDEVLGTLSGLNLAAFGTSPVHKDILIEYDWFDDSLGCGAHSHRPTAQTVNIVRDVFANAIVANPDGSMGINVIQDYGQGGLFTGGNFIDDPDGEITDGMMGQFLQYKALNFAPIRLGYFHYAILPHYLSYAGQTYAGLGEIPGDDFIVAVFCNYNNEWGVASTVVHELGHNLGLRHGGDEDCNYKPNYNSVMNYLYNGDGDSDCDAIGNGVIDYSYGRNRALNENDLDENLGVCTTKAVPIDWNMNGIIERSISRDLNFVDHSQKFSCGGTLTVLHDYDDWGNLYLPGVARASVVLNDSHEDVIFCDLPVRGAK